MLSNYLKIALRNLLRHKAHSAINIAGLAIGLVCTLLIFLWVQDELSYDRFNEKGDEIYRVVETQHYSGGKVLPAAVTPTALAGALKEEVPEITRSTRLSFNSLTVRHGENVSTEGVALVDPDFLEMFTLHFLEGNPKTALNEPHSLVLTVDAAKRYFGDEDPMGKTLLVENQYDFVVRAVIGNIPENSHLHYELLAPFVFAKELGSSMNDWNTSWCYTYVLLQPNAVSKAVNGKIVDFLGQHGQSNTQLALQPLREIHLYSAGKYVADIGGQGDIEYVRIFSGIALFVLLIACVNFMNLATARSERRAKEVGLRKVVGANRYHLILQFFGEAMLMTAIAFLVAIVCTQLILPAFNDLSGKALALERLNLAAVLGFLGITVAAGVLAGSYPALVLSSFQPAETMKKGMSSAAGGSSLRKILVVVQFTLSIMMIIGTLVVSRQIDYIRNKNLGFNKENVGYVWMAGDFRSKQEIAKRQLLKIPGITGITLTSQLPTNFVSASSGWDWEGKAPDEHVLMNFESVDDDYVKTFQMQMAAGRFFSPEMATDSLSAVVNETAVKMMGMKSPIGKTLKGRGKNLTIIGVVRDFNFKPIQTKIGPLVLLRNPSQYYAMIIRMKSNGISHTVTEIEKTYKEFNPETPFYFNFLDDDYNRLYRAEERTGKISEYFTFLAIFIAAMGLYGLASYTIEQRTKEIGVRKILGASVPDIIGLLTREYVWLVVLANILAWPVAYFAMNAWLEDFAYRISIGYATFLLAGGIALLIALLTVSHHAVKAAIANPVESLRYE
jgi:putative ABC transport system permease protein